jgi:hypothetical protein
LAQWLVAKKTDGTHLGSEALPRPPEGSDDMAEHALALTPEFQKLLDDHWPRDSAWIMVDTRRYIVYSANAGVLGFITLSAEPM